MKQQSNRQLCALMETNILSLVNAAWDAHGSLGSDFSKVSVSDLLLALAVNNIEIKCTYLGAADD
jgi:hypothetical protein